MGIRFYCGLNERQWNQHPVAPGPLACIAPVYGKSARTKATNSVYVPPGTAVIQDSGAFSDNWTNRLGFVAALDRQIAHADRYGYSDAITHRASYDLLIDEVWEDGNRHKRRWTENAAADAVAETVAAAEYLIDHRHGLNLVLSAQGVTAQQYLDCTRQIVPLLEDGDILGFGGWCVIGKMPKVMMPVFRETARLVVPFAAKAGVKRIHIWGVVYPKALGELLWMCDRHGIALSTDSAGPTRAPAFGQWGYGDWRDNTYQRHPPETRGLERARHVSLTRSWLERLETSPYYKEPKCVALPQQMILF